MDELERVKAQKHDGMLQVILRTILKVIHKDISRLDIRQNKAATEVFNTPKTGSLNNCLTLCKIIRFCINFCPYSTSTEATIRGFFRTKNFFEPKKGLSATQCIPVCVSKLFLGIKLSYLFIMLTSCGFRR